jgi:protein arginine kinase activator
MDCQKCGKNEAIIQLTKVENSEIRVLQLCEPCAAEQGIETVPPATAPLVDFLAQIGKGVAEDPSIGGCPSCGITQAQLKQVGRLGCADCYDHFEQHLRGLLRRLHGGTQHVGKVPESAGTGEVDRKAQVHTLRRSLQRAVESEDFEQAATLRDQIRQLETAPTGDDGDD